MKGSFVCGTISSVSLAYGLSLSNSDARSCELSDPQRYAVSGCSSVDAYFPHHWGRRATWSDRLTRSGILRALSMGSLLLWSSQHSSQSALRRSQTWCLGKLVWNVHIIHTPHSARFSKRRDKYAGSQLQGDPCGNRRPSFPIQHAGNDIGLFASTDDYVYAYRTRGPSPSSEVG